jgi:hypothetical protein
MAQNKQKQKIYHTSVSRNCDGWDGSSCCVPDPPKANTQACWISFLS